jgi:hypothetical protein
MQLVETSDQANAAEQRDAGRATATCPPSFASATFADECFRKLESEGICCLEGAVPDEYLAECRQQVRDYISSQGSRYFSIIQPYKEPDSRFSPLAHCGNFNALLQSLAVRAAGQSCTEGVGLYNVLRVIAGPDGTEKSLMFHYDATVITALVPIFIPEGQPHEAGDLIALPNARPIRRFALTNIAEKILIQNPLARKLLEIWLVKRAGTRYVVRLKPGNIYLFWGYRTLHANLTVRPNEVRSTLLFHFGDPHRNSLLTRAVLYVRKLRERRGLV